MQVLDGDLWTMGYVDRNNQIGKQKRGEFCNVCGCEMRACGLWGMSTETFKHANENAERFAMYAGVRWEPVNYGVCRQKQPSMQTKARRDLQCMRVLDGDLWTMGYVDRNNQACKQKRGEICNVCGCEMRTCGL